MRVACVTDSTAGLHDLDPGSTWRVIPLEIQIDGSRYREGPELSAADFHRMLHEVNTPPATVPPTVEAFVETYAPLLEAHDRILSVHLSGRLSDTIEHARAAAGRLGAADRIEVFDSRLAGAAVGLLCLEAQERLSRGGELEAVVGHLTRIVERTRVYFSVYTLDYLYLGGRLERRPRAGVASVEDRPILTLDDGRLELVERVVGETTRVERILELIEAEFGDDEPLTAAIVHAGPRGEAAAERLARALTAERERPSLCWTSPLGPVLCAHTGFDVCGLAVYPGALSALEGP